MTTELLTRGGKDIAFSDFTPLWKLHRRLVHNSFTLFGEGTGRLQDIGKTDHMMCAHLIHTLSIRTRFTSDIPHYFLSSVRGGQSVYWAIGEQLFWLRPVCGSDQGHHQRRVHFGIQRHLQPWWLRATGCPPLQWWHSTDDSQRWTGGHLPLDESRFSVGLAVPFYTLHNTLYSSELLCSFVSFRSSQARLWVNWRTVSPSGTDCYQGNWRSIRWVTSSLLS